MFNFLSEGQTNFLGAIGEKVSSFLNSYIDMAFKFLTNMPWWVELLIVLAVAILLIIGLIRFIVKTWKLFIVLLIVGAVGFGVYYFLLRDGGATNALINYTSLIQQLL